jgi:hypothetical protein
MAILSDNANNTNPFSANDLAMMAVNLFKNGADCETAVVTVFDQLLGTNILDGLEPKIRRIGLGFQVPCGAILGAKRILVRVLDGSDTANLIQDLDRFFVKKHRATTCQYLTAHIKWGEHHLYCGKYVYTVVEGLLDILYKKLGQKLSEALRDIDISATKH